MAVAAAITRSSLQSHFHIIFQDTYYKSVLRIRIRRILWDLPLPHSLVRDTDPDPSVRDTDPDPLVRDTDPDPLVKDTDPDH
jgi:hypothetical protein